MFNDLFQPIHLLILLFVAIPFYAVKAAPYWIAFKKAGFPAPLALLSPLPVIGLIVMYVVAFSEWKVLPALDYGYPPPAAYPPPGYVPAGAAYPPAAAPAPAYVPPPEPPASI